MDTAITAQDVLIVIVILFVLNAINVKVVCVHVQQAIVVILVLDVILALVAIIVQAVGVVKAVQQIVIVAICVQDIVQVVMAVTVAITAQEAVLVVMQNAIIAMMYIVGAVGLLVVVEAVELEMEIVNNMPNYLNNIVNYKFDSQCIYYNLRKYSNLHMHNKLYNYSNYHS